MEPVGETSYPLTPLQQGMVYHSRLAPGSGLYLQQLVGDLHEDVNVPCFKRAWQRLVARHAVLRTRFVSAVTGEPLQEVEPDAAIEWYDHDWSSLSSAEREAKWPRVLADDRRRDFDFTRGPLTRMALFRFVNDHYRFLWTFHHALLDGRSHLSVLKELFRFYEALCRGEDYQPEQRLAFARFVHWQSQKDHSASRDFWKEQLEGLSAPARLAFPPPCDRSTQDRDDRGSHQALLTREETSALEAFAAQEGVTLGTLVQAAWAVLLSRYGGSDDVVFGATRACRHSSVEGVESVAGLLINTVPLRVRMDADAPVHALLKTIRSTWVAMRPHEHTPLNKIQLWGGFDRNRPVFETILVFENYSLNEWLKKQEGDWIHREFQLLEKGDAPLAAVAYGGHRLSLRLAFDRKHLDDEAGARMVGHWRTVLLGLRAHADGKLEDLPLLTEAERRTILVEWNNTRREYSGHLCLHQLFEIQAAQTPGKPALLLEDGLVTYGELNVQANRLAHRLRSSGVGPEVRVVICLERSPEFVISVLAVLKAGGAYVPLDPAYPDESLSAMLADSGASALVTRSGLTGRLKEHGLAVVLANADGDAATTECDANPDSGVTADNLAYSIYTSGSTGQPKLIGVEHRSAVNTISFTTSQVLSPDDLSVVPFADAICFDASIHRMFAVLLSGGSLVILQSLFALAASRWAGAITSVGTVPSVLQALLADFQLPRSVRVVTVGGEATSDDLLRTLAGYPSLQKVINFYGPTEASMYCSRAVLMDRREDQRLTPDGTRGYLAGRPNNIGRPIGNVRMYILNERLQPLPIGIAGELCVGGKCLARGYLNQPALTAEKFVADPFVPDGRLYRTGDLVRYLPDGNIEFLGRIDDQVKIHGLRVEPRGIEAVLSEHTDVRHCIVRALESAAGQKRLVAYVVPARGERDEGASSDRLRRHLERKLSPGLVPQAFVFLDRFPRTPIGKLDYRALPEPDFGRDGAVRCAVRPGTDEEKTIAWIWEKVLGVTDVGLHDDFLAIGGDSLSAMRMLNRVNKAFGTELSLAVALTAPTVAALSAVVADRHPVNPPRTSS